MIKFFLKIHWKISLKEGKKKKFNPCKRTMNNCHVTMIVLTACPSIFIHKWNAIWTVLHWNNSLLFSSLILFRNNKKLSFIRNKLILNFYWYHAVHFFNNSASEKEYIYFFFRWKNLKFILNMCVNKNTKRRFVYFLE